MAAGIAVAALTAATPGIALAAPSFSAQALAAAGPATYDDKLKVAIKFGRGDDFALIELADRDFVIAIWNHVKDNPDATEVRAAAEAAFSAAPELVDAACYQFILTDVFTAFDRDVEREKREADAKRQSDLARSAAAASIDVVADAALLDGTDTDFIRLIWERVADDVKWPKVKEAARVARDGSAEAQQAFIATGMAEAAKQDTDDRIAADIEKTEAEKAAALARSAKKSAANRIGLTVTDELLALPDRDFIIQVWNNTPDGSEVQDAAIAATRSLDPAVWKAFIDLGIHQAKDRDIQIALDKKEAEDRRLVQDIVTRAVAAGQRGLAAAARTALAGNATVVADFLRVGQYGIGPDVKQLITTGSRVGMITADGVAYVNEGAVDAPWVTEYRNVKQISLSLNRIGVLTTAGVALVKEGGLSAGWATEYPSGVKQLVLHGTRIGIVLNDGTAYVKEGALSGAWVKQYTGVKQLAMSGQRIGVLLTDGTAYVKEGTLASTGWVKELTAVKDLSLSGTRIAVIKTDNSASSKVGALNAAWVSEGTNVTRIALGGARIGVLYSNGTGRVASSSVGVPELTGPLPTGAAELAIDTVRVCYISSSDGTGHCLTGNNILGPYMTYRTTANPA